MLLFDVSLLTDFLGKFLCGGTIRLLQGYVPKPNGRLAVSCHIIDVSGMFYDIALQILVIHKLVLEPILNSPGTVSLEFPATETIPVAPSKYPSTFNFATGKMDSLEVPGRHDVCFALRAPVVVEAVTAITLADLILISRH